MSDTVALIGCGEAGTTFAAAADGGGRTLAFDLIPARAAALAKFGIETAGSSDDAVSAADIVLSLVTAEQALSAARTAARALRPRGLYCDFNSVGPKTKRKAAKEIEAAGGRYLDVAILAPVIPARLGVPLLVSGPHALAAQPLLEALGFTNVRVVGDEVGRASAIKMIRSVMVKGIEALTDECAAAADAAGVLDEVVASLDASEKSSGWAERFAYNRERMAAHGLRRAAEMKEVAATLRGLGVKPVMSEATVERQRAAGTQGPIRRNDAA